MGTTKKGKEEKLKTGLEKPKTYFTNEERLAPMHEAFGTSSWDELKEAILAYDKKIGEEVKTNDAITNEQIVTLLKKKGRRNVLGKFQSFFERMSDKAIERAMDKTLTVKNGDNTLSIGNGNNNPPPPPNNKVPVGVWVALALFLLIALVFVVMKFVIKRED